ncbi:enoyl-coa delta isomerase 1 [Quercus suber]|uniref:Enoyl-coa delta isomerase 1 n=1 Tax=Quercus suber TaxID=58331 RepID=A0AAW0L7Y8_QUESU
MDLWQDLMLLVFLSVIAALISLPIPTIAPVFGHAAGLILVLGHYYVLMRRHRGFLYMSEVDLAITLPDYFSALLRSKISCRDIMVDAQCGEVLYIPGVMTPTEVYPISALGGSWYISALKRPFHHISMVVSQGITIGC